MKKLISIVLIMLFITIGLFAQEDEKVLVAGEGEKKVIVTGYGENFEMALEQTMRNAVEKAVGSYITSSTLIENNELIEDKILSLSRGFVKDYKIISESEVDNEFKLIASVIITDSQIMETIKASGINVEIEGQKMFQQFQSFNKQIEDEFILIKEVLNDLPRAPIVDYTIEVGGPVQVGDFYEIPIVIKGDLNKNFSNEIQNLKNFMAQTCFEKKNFTDIHFAQNGYKITTENLTNVGFNGIIESIKDRKRKNRGFFSTEKKLSNTEFNNIASQYKHWTMAYFTDNYRYDKKRYKTILDRDRSGNLSTQREEYYDIFDKQYSPFVICSLDKANIIGGKKYKKEFKQMYYGSYYGLSDDNIDFRDRELLSYNKFDVTMFKFLNEKTFFYICDYIQNLLLDVGFKVTIQSDADHTLEFKFLNVRTIPNSGRKADSQDRTTLVLTKKDSTIFTNYTSRYSDHLHEYKFRGREIYKKKSGIDGYFKKDARIGLVDLYGYKIQTTKIPFVFNNRYYDTPDGIFSCLTHESGSFASNLRFLPTENIYPESDRSYIQFDDFKLVIPAEIFSKIESISINPLPVNEDIPLGDWLDRLESPNFK